MKCVLALLVWSASSLSSSVVAFLTPLSQLQRGALLMSSDQEQEPPSLILGGDEMEQQMKQLRSKYPTSEADYLAAARARAKARPESVNSMATQQDYEKVAEEKKKEMGGMDFEEWEAKQAEESQLLIDNGGDGDEPTLLL